LFEPSLSPFHPASCSRGFSDELDVNCPFSQPASFLQAPLGLLPRLNNSQAGSRARTCPLPQPTETHKFSNYTRQAMCCIPKVRDSHGTPKGNGQQFRTSNFPPCFQETEVRPRSPIFDTPYWSAFSLPLSELYGGREEIPLSPERHSSSCFWCIAHLSSPISIGQFPSLNTHSSPANPNPLSRASNRNQSLNSPVVASLILHAGVISFARPISTVDGNQPLSADIPSFSYFRCVENPYLPHRTGQQSNQLISFVPHLQSSFRSHAGTG